MTDLHTHILPGLDDGARDLYDTLAMADLAVRSGTTDLIATPHCNLPYLYENYYNGAYQAAFEAAARAIEEEGIPLRLWPGMEVYCTADLPGLIEEGLVVPLNGSRYLLMEFDFGEDPAFAARMLGEVQALGLTPVVAHPERYEFVQQSPAVAARWQAAGCLLQVNKGSLLGRFGPEAQTTAWQLLRQRAVAAVASDAHRPDRRTPWLVEAYEAVAEQLGQGAARFLFETGPGAICRGQALPPRQPDKEDRQWESYD